MTATQLHPAEACARCGRSLDQTGGKRLLIPRFWSETEIAAGGGRLQIIREMHEGRREPAVIQPLPAGWSQEDRDRVREGVRRAEEEGKIPWVCQPCLNRVCKTCRAPLACSPCSTILKDNGDVSHGPWFGEYLGCVNPACTGYRGKK